MALPPFPAQSRASAHYPASAEPLALDRTAAPDLKRAVIPMPESKFAPTRLSHVVSHCTKAYRPTTDAFHRLPQPPLASRPRDWLFHFGLVAYSRKTMSQTAK